MASKRTPGLPAAPEPFIRQKALGDCNVTHELKVCSDQPQAMGPTYKALHQNILDVFYEYSVPIMLSAEPPADSRDG